MAATHGRVVQVLGVRSRNARGLVSLLVSALLVAKTSSQDIEPTCKARAGPGWVCSCPAKVPGDAKSIERHNACEKLKNKRLMSVNTKEMAPRAGTSMAWDYIRCDSHATRRLAEFNSSHLAYVHDEVPGMVQRAFALGGVGHSLDESESHPNGTAGAWLQWLGSDLLEPPEAEGAEAIGGRPADDDLFSRRRLSVANDFKVVDDILDAGNRLKDETIEFLHKRASKVAGVELVGYDKKNQDGFKFALKSRTSAYRKFLGWCGPPQYPGETEVLAQSKCTQCLYEKKEKGKYFWCNHNDNFGEGTCVKATKSEAAHRQDCTSTRMSAGRSADPPPSSNKGPALVTKAQECDVKGCLNRDEACKTRAYGHGDMSAQSCGDAPICMTDLLRFTIIGPDRSAGKAHLENFRKAIKLIRDDMAKEKAELVNKWPDGTHFGNTLSFGNGYLGVNELYAWPVPLEGLGCIARFRSQIWASQAATGYNDRREPREKNQCGDTASIIKVLQNENTKAPAADRSPMEFYMMRMEVQYHTKCSYFVKQEMSHTPYEVAREGKVTDVCKKAQAKIVNGNLAAMLYFHIFDQDPPPFVVNGEPSGYTPEQQAFFNEVGKAVLKGGNDIPVYGYPTITEGTNGQRVYDGQLCPDMKYVIVNDANKPEMPTNGQLRSSTMYTFEYARKFKRWVAVAFKAMMEDQGDVKYATFPMFDGGPTEFEHTWPDGRKTSYTNYMKAVKHAYMLPEGRGVCVPDASVSG